MTFWRPFDDHLRNFWRPQDFEDVDNVLRNWGRLGYLLWTSDDFEGFDDLLRNLRTLWGSVENLRSEDLGYLLCIFLTFWTLWTWGLFEDRRTWCSQNIEEHSLNFWWTSCGPIEDLRPFEELKDFSGHWGSSRTWLPTEELRTLINFWGLCGRFDDLWVNRGDFEDHLRTWGLRTLGTFLCIFLTFWGLCGRFEDFLKTWGPEYLKTLKNFSGPFDWLLVDLLRSVFRNFWGLCEDHLMNIWGTFADHRILKTLITFWGLWCRLEYLLWTYEDFEGFDDLLRNLRTFWGSFENLRPEDLVYLLCIFLTFWGLCGHFEDFLKTWGPEDLRTLKNLSGTFDDFLWTYLRTWCF